MILIFCRPFQYEVLIHVRTSDNLSSDRLIRTLAIRVEGLEVPLAWDKNLPHLRRRQFDSRCVPPRYAIVIGLDLEMKWRIFITRAVNARDNLFPFALTLSVPDEKQNGIAKCVLSKPLQLIVNTLSHHTG